MKNTTVEWLELHNGKLLRAVLRGRGHRKVPELPSQDNVTMLLLLIGTDRSCKKEIRCHLKSCNTLEGEKTIDE